MLLWIPLFSKVEKQNVVLTKTEEIYSVFFRINKLETFVKNWINLHMNDLPEGNKSRRRKDQCALSSYLFHWTERTDIMEIVKKSDHVISRWPTMYMYHRIFRLL